MLPYPRLALLAGCLFLPGCISPEGVRRSVWSRAELVEWYTKHEPANPGIGIFGYAGSDGDFHYFITRPVDSFFTPRVPRSELEIPDERPRRDLGKRLYYYRVDPAKNFRKIPDE